MNRISSLSVFLRQFHASTHHLTLRASSSLQVQRILQATSGLEHQQQQQQQRRQIHKSFRFDNANATSTAEKVVGNPVKYEFLAETKQLLDIVAKSLYSEKEVFVRELISNASDAIEKLKYIQLTSTASADASQIPFEIKIEANDMNNTLTIHDTGVGMSKDELIKNLGTIAHSGSKVFSNCLFFFYSFLVLRTNFYFWACWRYIFSGVFGQTQREHIESEQHYRSVWRRLLFGVHGGRKSSSL